MLSLDDIQVGMRLKIMDKPPLDIYEYPGWDHEMNDWLGATMTVRSVTRFVKFYEDSHCRDGLGWCWAPEWLSIADEDDEYNADDVADDTYIESLFC